MLVTKRHGGSGELGMNDHRNRYNKPLDWGKSSGLLYPTDHILGDILTVSRTETIYRFSIISLSFFLCLGRYVFMVLLRLVNQIRFIVRI